MKQWKYALLAPVAVLALVVAGCGGSDSNGGGSVPSDAVAVVGDQTISKSEFDSLLSQAKRGYDQQKRKFPDAGTPEYEQLKSEAVAYLVQKAEFQQAADKMGITISDQQVDNRIAQIKKQYFNGSNARYEAQLKSQGLSEAQVRSDVETVLLRNTIFSQVTSDVKVSDKDIADYYDSHKDQFKTAESRNIRHILVACGSSPPATAGGKKSKSCADAKGLADRIYTQLQNGGNFATLAKKYSDDPGSKAQGGKLTVAKGQTVPPFDKAAFALSTKQISKPVKTQFGWHIIQPLSAIKKAHVTPLAQAKASIRQQLLQQKKNDAWNAWVQKTKKDYDVRYQAGYQPQTTQKQ